MVPVIETLDARGLICPMPVIRTQQRVAELSTGQVLEISCTDPGALIDIPAWCRVHGHQVIATESSADQSTVRLRVCN